MITSVVQIKSPGRRGIRFAQHGLVLRSIANVGVLAIFYIWTRDNPVHFGYWVFAILTCMFWPVTAYLITFWARNSYVGECCNVYVDAGLCGVMSALLGFTFAPASALFLINTMAFISVFGLKGLFYSAFVFTLAAVGFHLFKGGDINLTSSQPLVVATMLYVAVFSFYHSYISFKVSRNRKKKSAMLEEISRLDGLSGLHNRGYWESSVQKEFEECTKGKKNSVVLLIDIDNFKEINDKRGHVIGDNVISALGEMIKQNIRPGDIAGRYGGDEFGIVLSNIDAKKAGEIAERLRENIEHESGAINGLDICFTISIGIQTFSSVFKSHREWVVAADEALYKAKDEGKNCSFVGVIP